MKKAINDTSIKVFLEAYNLLKSKVRPSDELVLEVYASASLVVPDPKNPELSDALRQVDRLIVSRGIPEFDLTSAIQQIISDIPRADSDGFDPAGMDFWNVGRILNGIDWAGGDTRTYRKIIKRSRLPRHIGFFKPPFEVPLTPLGEAWFSKAL